ncbi:FxsA family protein [Halorarum halobium]|uniref:FxsA family protein n=1 Tax=Halorarum halobium TaxID=3075121 RepID=UPI0028AC1F15|nr:FxsA family protein [Halobaculum sp. XH14]
MRARYVIALLLLIPLADAAFLVVVAGEIGPVATVALVVLTGLFGMLLVRAEGRHTVRSLQRKLASGQLPTTELLDGALLIAAGAFLLTPGLVTDAIGFLLAVPPTRYPIRELLDRYVLTPYIDSRTDGFATGAVWTSGFPGDAGSGGGVGGVGGTGGGSDGPGGGSSGPGSGRGGAGDVAGSAGSERDESGEDVVDVDPDDYSVEKG